MPRFFARFAAGLIPILAGRAAEPPVPEEAEAAVVEVNPNRRVVMQTTSARPQRSGGVLDALAMAWSGGAVVQHKDHLEVSAGLLVAEVLVLRMGEGPQ